MLIPGVLAGCHRDSLRLVEDESAFGEFAVEENAVILTAAVTVENVSDTNKTFAIRADFSKDQRGDLLKEAELWAVDDEGNTAKFTVPAKGKTEFEVRFCGTFGGKEQRADRLLPPLTFVEAG
ncbi:MAG: hypothetical protein ACOYJY_00310 [Acutalibacteraceae bacterium]